MLLDVCCMTVTDSAGAEPCPGQDACCCSEVEARASARVLCVKSSGFAPAFQPAHILAGVDSLLDTDLRSAPACFARGGGNLYA